MTRHRHSTACWVVYIAELLAEPDICKRSVLIPCPSEGRTTCQSCPNSAPNSLYLPDYYHE